jgi:putative membrane protein
MPAPYRGEASGMGMGNNSNGHTAREEAEGKVVWEKLQAKELNCEDLSDDNFGALGEYFMGQMAGEQHEAMNNMTIQMMGEDGEKEMHIAMGKRMSGCEPNAPMPQNMMDSGMMPMMMNMMMGGGMMSGGSNSMMGNFATNPIGWFGFGWIFMILFWGIIIVGVIALIKLMLNQSRSETGSKSALDILKERYAKGEIGKKEFEEKKKDLS